MGKIEEEIPIIEKYLNDNFSTVKKPEPEKKQFKNLKNQVTEVLEEKEKLSIEGDTLIKEFSEVSPYIWSINYRSLKGKPYQFDGEHLTQKRKFLIQPLEDMSPHKGCEKARQMGISENSVSEVLWFLDTKDHTKAIYVLPSGRQSNDFSNTRIVPAIDESEHLCMKKGEIQNVNLKQIGNSYLFLRSGHLARLGEGVDSDFTIFDEEDRMAPGILVAFQESLKSSKWGFIREVSTPTIPGYGINVNFQKSCQWTWFIKCSHCNKWQTLTWVQDEADEFNGKVSIGERNTIHVYICKHCSKEITDEDRSDGQWIAKYPSRKEYSFYKMSQLMSPWISAETLWKKQEDYPFRQLFYNYALGLPYLGEGVLITESIIMNCLSKDIRICMPLPDMYFNNNQIAIGVDWGDVSYVVLATLWKDKILLFPLEIVDSPDPEQHVSRVGQIIEQFGINIACCDAGYGKDRNAKLLKAFPDKIYSVFYVEGKNKITQPEWDDKDCKVSVDRTNSLKLNLSSFKNDIILPRGIEMILFTKFVKHLCNLAIVREMDDKTGEVTEFIASTGADHFAHACNYAILALSKVVKMPKSEFFMVDSGMIRVAQKENMQNIINSASPEVPGYTDTNSLLVKSAFQGVLKGECYGQSYKENDDKCYNCSQGRSCRNLCQ